MGSVAATDLRPWGKVEIGGRYHEAEAANGFIASGSRVEVIGAKAAGLVVRESSLQR